MMQYRLPAILGAFLALSATVATADDKALLARADQAFAQADYATALSIYEKIEPKLPDGSQKQMLQERMRFCTRQLEALKNAPPPPAPSTQPAAAVETQAPVNANRVKHVRPKDGEVLSLTLHDLGNFEFDENDESTIPEDVRALDGAKVRIEGEMFTMDQVAQVKRFLLVNDMLSCCYGVMPKLQNTVLVSFKNGGWVAPTRNRIAVEGVLRVSVQREDGFVLSIFQLEPTSIKRAL